VTDLATTETTGVTRRTETAAARAAEPAAAPGWGLPHEPGLDGLRGLAVAAVVGYHLGLSWMKGGFLGVSLFFTLSGFLITNLLLVEREATGSVGLGAFWGRRARRLLPAAYVGMAMALVFAALAGRPEQLIHLPGDLLAAVLYIANWRFILAHSAYGAGYLAPSPILHYWSLAIEEQLYLVLPVLVLVVTRRRASRARLAAAVGALMVASAGVTLLLRPGADANRIYFGTDTRMFELFAGVLLALAIRFPAVGGRPRRSSRPLAALGVAAMTATLVLWTTVAEGDRWLYRGGLWVVAALSCGLIVGALQPGSVGGALRWPALLALGRVSYGVYVYHWPLFLLLDGERTRLHGLALVVVRLAATGVVAWASHRYLEQPIRQRRWRPSRTMLALAPVVPAAIVVVALVVSGKAAGRAVAAAPRHAVVLPASAVAAPLARSSPTPVPPLTKVLFMGDSLVHQAFPTFASRLLAAGVQAEVVGAPGESMLTRQAAWLSQLQQAVTGFDPDVVVLESCCGAKPTDAPLLGPEGHPLDPDSLAFYAQWRRLAVTASAIGSARGAAVLWVLGPPAHTNGFYGPIDVRIPRVNQVYQSLAFCGPGTGFVDWRVVTGPDGGYTDYLPNDQGQQVRIRMADGFHFTPAGIDILARLTISGIDRQWASDGGRPGPLGGSCP